VKVITPDVGSATVQGIAPTLVRGTVIVPTTGTLNIEGYGLPDLTDLLFIVEPE
jgi:hypothetical protein